MIPFSCPLFAPEDLIAAKDCYDRGQVDAGPLVSRFERQIAHLLNVPERWVMCVGSGTAALEVASRLRPYQSVAASVLTWPGTFSYLEKSVTPIDLGPELDGRPDYLRADDEDLQIFVQLWGVQPFPDGFPSHNCAKHIVLDAAHNLFDPRHTDLLEQGVTVCYSFGPLKQITTGRGGAVVSQDFDDLYVRLQAEAYCHYGVYGRTLHRTGRNLGMTEPAAAIGLSQLKRWESMQNHRLDVLATYSRILKDRLVTKPSTSSGHLAVAKIPPGQIAYVQEAMRDFGVLVGHHYPIWAANLSAPQAAMVSQCVCTLPCHLKMTVEHAEQIANNFLEVLDEADPNTGP